MESITNLDSETPSSSIQTKQQQIEKLRHEITKRCTTILRLENRSNPSEIENLIVMEELGVKIKRVADKYKSLPILMSEIKLEELDDIQSMKLQLIQDRVESLQKRWSEMYVKHQKHRKECESHTSARSITSTRRAAMWNISLKMENIDKLESMLAYFECQKIMYPPVPLGTELLDLWNKYDLQTKAIEVVYELSQLLN